MLWFQLVQTAVHECHKLMTSTYCWCVVCVCVHVWLYVCE